MSPRESHRYDKQTQLTPLIKWIIILTDTDRSNYCDIIYDPSWCRCWWFSCCFNSADQNNSIWPPLAYHPQPAGWICQWRVLMGHDVSSRESSWLTSHSVALVCEVERRREQRVTCCRRRTFAGLWWRNRTSRLNWILLATTQRTGWYISCHHHICRRTVCRMKFNHQPQTRVMTNWDTNSWLGGF